MLYQMKLLTEPFEKMKAGQKTVEIRLNDEKRQLINVGDSIEFSKLPGLIEKLHVEVVELKNYQNFKEMIDNLDIEVFGYPAEFSKEKFIEMIYSIYSPKQEKEFGVLAIKIKLK